MTASALRSRRTLCIAAASTILLMTACSGGGDSPPPSATASSSQSPGSTMPVDDAAMLTIYGDGEGAFPSDQPGLAVADLNGDGVDDFAAGARFADPPTGQDAGAAYVVFGRGDLPETLDIADNDQDVTILGPGPGANLGFSATAADLNGDGDADLVLGAPFATSGGQQVGAAYVFFGPLDRGIIDLSSSPADVTITGPGAGSFFGDSLAAGDLNGDAISDLIVGATFAAEPGRPPGGAVFAFLGHPEWTPSVAAAAASAVVYGAEEFDELGDFVAAGDVNADGVDDIIATAEAADGPDNARNTAAEVHVIFGVGRGFGGVFRIADGQANLSVYGAAAQDTLGFALAVSDLDSDGADDIAMSAHLASESRGTVYVLRGGPSLSGEIDLGAPPDGVVAISGESPGDLLATSVAIAGERLVLGASFADSGAGQDAGSVYVLPPGFTASGTTGEQVITYTGSAPSSRLGANIAAGDINGDGRTDLVIIAELAPGPDESRPRAGRIYVVTP